MNCHPFLYWTARNGSWCHCLYGWKSRDWTTVTGAHLEFGQHLVKKSHEDSGR
jgi:hypothetical protein